MKIITIPSSGKLGLSVRMPGRYGQVERQWVVPANPQSAAQIAVRARLQSFAAGWDVLTSGQRLAWNVAAAEVQSKSRLGFSGKLTGLQYFVQVNCNLDLLGQDPVDTPPGGVVITMPAPQSLTITNTGGVIAIKLACPTSPGSATLVRAAAPKNAGVSKASGLAFIGACPAPAQGSSDITTLYTLKWGIPPVGKRIFVACQKMDSGIMGPKRSFDALVPASA